MPLAQSLGPTHFDMLSSTSPESRCRSQGCSAASTWSHMCRAAKGAGHRCAYMEASRRGAMSPARCSH
eukprot:11116546-Prorocentrum_lima.AAC.1